MSDIANEFRDGFVKRMLSGTRFGQDVTIQGTSTTAYVIGQGVTRSSDPPETWRASPIFTKSVFQPGGMESQEVGYCWLMASGKTTKPEKGEHLTVASETWVITGVQAFPDDGTATGAGVAAYRVELER